MYVLELIAAFSLFSPSYQQKDPLKDFCRIFGHQTAVVDRKLFIDGGLVNWRDDSSNYTSGYLFQFPTSLIKHFQFT